MANFVQVIPRISETYPHIYIKMMRCVHIYPYAKLWLWQHILNWDLKLPESTKNNWLVKLCWNVTHLFSFVPSLILIVEWLIIRFVAYWSYWAWKADLTRSVAVWAVDRRNVWVLHWNWLAILRWYFWMNQPRKLTFLTKLILNQCCSLWTGNTV